MIFTFICFMGFLAGGILWFIGYSQEQKQKLNGASTLGRASGEVVTMGQNEQADGVRNGITALSTQYAGLPAVPVSPLQYDGWFEEVRKRIQMRSLGLTVLQETTLRNQLTALQGAKVAGANTEASLHLALANLAVTRVTAMQHAEMRNDIDDVVDIITNQEIKAPAFVHTRLPEALSFVVLFGVEGWMM